MLEEISSQARPLWQTVLGPWFSARAIRHRWQLDYKLSARARSVRWGVIAACYSAALTPGANFAAFRVSAGFIALGFLCWPNFAYHLTKLFEDWPATEGTPGSSEEQSTRRRTERYDFEFNGERYGGTSKVRRIPGLAVKEAYPDGALVVVGFDPLNPGNSAVVERSASRMSR
jgi:hypothetical protein